MAAAGGVVQQQERGGAGYLSGARQKTGVGWHSKLSMDLFELISFILAVLQPRQEGNILCCISPTVFHVLVIVFRVTCFLSILKG